MYKIFINSKLSEKETFKHYHIYLLTGPHVHHIMLVYDYIKDKHTNKIKWLL